MAVSRFSVAARAIVTRSSAIRSWENTGERSDCDVLLHALSIPNPPTKMRFCMSSPRGDVEDLRIRSARRRASESPNCKSGAFYSYLHARWAWKQRTEAICIWIAKRRLKASIHPLSAHRQRNRQRARVPRWIPSGLRLKISSRAEEDRVCEMSEVWKM